MNCENCFCIYQTEGKCLLEEISLDISGMCTNRIYTDIDENILYKAKSMLLDKYEDLDE